mgnify:CR=1 FL=1
MRYFICEFCGNSKKILNDKIKLYPKCGCKLSLGARMLEHNKYKFKAWEKNKRNMKNA